MFSAKNTYFPDIFEEDNKEHGRIETRDNIAWLAERHPKWENLKSIAKVTGIRRIVCNETIAVRYYISSQDANAKEHVERSRQHWSIGNNLHWVLDVQFREDNCFIRKKAPENMAIFRKMALNIREDHQKRSVNGFRGAFG